MVLQAASVHKDTHLVVYSSDTDVLLFIVHHLPAVHTSTTFYTGKQRQNRYLYTYSCPGHDTYLQLGQKRSAAFIGVHAFIGCDVTVRFGGITKDWCFKVFLTCDDRILDALGHFGKEVLEPDTWAQLERFVCPIFKHRAVKDLRWFFFSNRAAEGENLPPIFGALYSHILWANFV